MINFFKIFIFLVFATFPILAKTISLQGLQIKLIDKNNLPVKGYEMSFKLVYSTSKPGISCLFSSGAPSLSSSLFCDQTEYSDEEIRFTDENGVINLKDIHYSVWRAKMMYIDISFLSTSVPKCLDFNYFRSAMTNEMVHDASLKIHRDTVRDIKQKKSSVITCVLE